MCVQLVYLADFLYNGPTSLVIVWNSVIRVQWVSARVATCTPAQPQVARSWSELLVRCSYKILLCQVRDRLDVLVKSFCMRFPLVNFMSVLWKKQGALWIFYFILGNQRSFKRKFAGVVSFKIIIYFFRAYSIVFFICFVNASSRVFFCFYASVLF